MKSERIPLAVITGPTASGKTGLSLAVCEAFDGEVICADSMQVYRGMPIASAAPTPQEKARVPHHLFEFLDPGTPFCVAEYVEMAHREIRAVAAKGKLPVLVGGTGLYIDSVVDNITFVPEKSDPQLRSELECRFDELGGEGMLRSLAEFDPQAAARLHPNDRRRIIRAFEIHALTGLNSKEQRLLSHREESPYRPIMLAVSCRERQNLYNRINARVDQMVGNGLVEEARRWIDQPGQTACQAIGHKELAPYFSGKKSLEECLKHLKQQTRRYAKRQLTWFRRDERIHWVFSDDPGMTDQAITYIRERL